MLHGFILMMRFACIVTVHIPCIVTVRILCIVTVRILCIVTVRILCIGHVFVRGEVHKSAIVGVLRSCITCYRWLTTGSQV